MEHRPRIRVPLRSRSMHDGSYWLQSKMVCDLPRHPTQCLQRLCEQLVERS